MSHLHRRNENWVLSNPIESEISRNSIDGMSGFVAFGERDGINPQQQGSDIWRGTSSIIPIPNQIVGEQMMLVSSNYDDRLNGTGIQKVEIDYLDAKGVESFEILSLNGTAFVRSVGTNIRFVNAIHATQVGVGTVASGDISICTNGTISNVYNMISVGGNMSLNTQRMIPYNKTFYLHEWSASCVMPNATTISRVRLRSTAVHGTRISNVFLFTDTAHLANSSYNKDFHVPIKIPQLSIIKATAYINPNGTNVFVSASYSGSLETNE